MSKIHPVLSLHVEQLKKQLADKAVGHHLYVHIRHHGTADELRAKGVHVVSDAGGIAIVHIALGDLAGLEAIDSIDSVEQPTPMHLTLDTSVPAIHADVVRTGSPSYTGSGVIVGIVDTGIDIFHHNFRKSDDSTRILFIWDQTLTAAVGEQPPPTLPLGTGQFVPPATQPGVEFNAAAIGQMLASNAAVPRHVDMIGHGTHVAGIAAGNALESGNCHLSGHYYGVAPDADLIIVKAFPDPQPKPKAGQPPPPPQPATNLMAGVDYILARAQALNRPVAINCSFGGEIGQHDGTDSEDVHLDGLLVDATSTPIPGRVIVVAAGNDGDIGVATDIADKNYYRGVHSSGTISASGTATVRFFVPPNDLTADNFILLFTGGQLQLQLAAPSGPAPLPVAPGSGTVSQVVGPDTVAYSAPAGSAWISFTITPTTSGNAISSGWWTATLTETTGTAAVYDFYISTSHSDPFPVFDFPNRTAEKTINTPGTARNVITVGGFASVSGDLYPTSSRGPTRATDGRQKPDISAPSDEQNPAAGIVAPMGQNSLQAYKDPCACCCCQDFYIAMDGTSMAAPHVTGVAALMLQRNPALTFDQIRATMQTFHDAPPGGVAVPNNDWGYGKIDAQLAVYNVPPASSGGGGGGTTISADFPLDIAGSAASGTERMAKRPGLAEVRTAGSGLPAPLGARLRALMAAVEGSEAASLAAALVSTHADEVARLVNTQRRVAVMWHRMHGPDILRDLLHRSDLEGALLPATIAGEPLGPRLERLIRVLDRYGSKRLRADIATYGAVLRAMPGMSLKDLSAWDFALRPVPSNDVRHGLRRHA
jgi:subtilisin family serine protease